MSGFIDTFRRKMSIRRIAFLGVLISGVAVLLFVFAALMTDGDLPRTPAEWCVSIVGSVIVWPVVAASRILHIESGLIIWPLWLASGFFWSLLAELLFVRRNHVA
jgi:hypothetical protein